MRGAHEVTDATSVMRGRTLHTDGMVTYSEYVMNGGYRREEQTMTWDAFHRRGEVLRNVIEVADSRRDGVLPMELPGVAETFGDETALVAALQLRWHTRLSGQIERALCDEPAKLETAVLTAWRRTASELPGIRAILDACTEQPADSEMAEALTRANRKEWVLLAAMAGQASAADAGAVRLGRRLEDKARAAYDPASSRPASTTSTSASTSERGSMLERLLAHLAA
jgi:hypothetical protein